MYYFRRKYIDWKIKNDGESRQKQYVDLKSAQSVVVLFRAKDVSEASFHEIKRTLTNHFEKVYFVIYQNNKNIVLYDFTALNFSKKDVTFCKPQPHIVSEFLSYEADILIDLTLKEKLSLKYLAGISKARCKCGLNKDGYFVYDLEIRNEQPVTAEDLLREILKYLEMIKTK